MSYFSPEISGSKEEIEWHQFDGPQVIKLTRGQFTFIGVPYTVAEWQKRKVGQPLLGNPGGIFQEEDTDSLSR